MFILLGLVTDCNVLQLATSICIVDCRAVYKLFLLGGDIVEDGADISSTWTMYGTKI